MGVYEELKEERVGYTVVNAQGLEMTCVEYNNAHDIMVEFKNPYYKIKSNWSNFIYKKIKNPYYPTVHGVGIIGTKYDICQSNKKSREYTTWASMLKRCFSKTFKEDNLAYKDVTCCEEWFLFDNFYEWLHGQGNFDKWITGKRWCLDKDILLKGNKIYSPNTCCLVPMNVNILFVNHNTTRGNLPIGVHVNGNGYNARCRNPFYNKIKDLGTYNSKQEAFSVYKKYKEHLIQQVAKEEYDNSNITKECYNAMINYKVEITD